MNDIEKAAIPTAVAILKAFQQFLANMGTDPAQLALKFPGASKILVGTIEMQFPSLAAAEFGAAEADVDTRVTNLITKLEAVPPAT